MSIINSDLKRYRTANGKFEWYEPSVPVIIFFRIGSYIRSIKFKPVRIFLSIFHLPVYSFLSLLTGIIIPRGCKIGKGLRIYHFGCIVLNPETIMGENCTLRQGVTIGTKNEDHDVPVIGNNVEFGAGCKVLGKIKIGDNVIIGANAVVVSDVPDNSIAVGIPARIIPRKPDKNPNESPAHP